MGLVVLVLFNVQCHLSRVFDRTIAANNGGFVEQGLRFSANFFVFPGACRVRQKVGQIGYYSTWAHLFTRKSHRQPRERYLEIYSFLQLATCTYIEAPLPNQRGAGNLAAGRLGLIYIYKQIAGSELAQRIRAMSSITVINDAWGQQKW